MKIGAVMFFTTDSMQPAALGRALADTFVANSGYLADAVDRGVEPNVDRSCLEELGRALSLEMFERLSREIKACGFEFVTLDLEGFRSGSMNALLKVEDLR